MRTTFVAAALGVTSALLIGACTTTPDDQSPAKVEERSVGSGGKPPPPTVTTPPVKPVDVTGSSIGDPRSILKTDPVLSRRSIYYDLDRFDVRDEYRGLIEAHAKYLRDNPGARMLIQGNADDRGSREYNVGLGQRRSDGIRKMMTLLGVKDAQIESVSLGEEKPQADGQNEAAWSKNRRSDILYGGEY